jgi:hypothetical protein
MQHNAAVVVTQTVVVIDNQKTNSLKPCSNQRQDLHRQPDINVVVIGEADNCTANPVVAWVSDTSTGCPVTVTRIYKVTDNAKIS